LSRKKAEGVILGRPKGSKSKVKKLTGKEAEIKTLLDKKICSIYFNVGLILCEGSVMTKILLAKNDGGGDSDNRGAVTITLFLS
jgi:hypothetical protein